MTTPSAAPATRVLTLAGAPALSGFRVQRLLLRLQSHHSGISAVHTRFVHFAELGAPLDAAASEVLGKLLQYGPRRHAESLAGEFFLVVPRPGTLSPWSSKATDIARAVRGEVALGNRLLAFAQRAQESVLGAVAQECSDVGGYDRHARRVHAALATQSAPAGSLIDGRI